MSYVQANTTPVFGRRSQALGRLGWYNGPFPQYRQPEMSRTRGQVPIAGYTSPSDPTLDTERNGAVTYRIDPSTGKYRFYNVDILPRGVFTQNTFQPPARPALSALGVPVTRVRRRRKGFLSSIVWGDDSVRRRGLGCNCGGKCSSGANRGLGDDDTFTDPKTGCISDSDGNLLKCPGPDPYFDVGNQVAVATGAPSAQSGQGQIQSVPVGIVQSIVSAFTQKPVVSQPATPAVQQPSWLNGSTRIGNTAIPNGALALGGAVLAVAAISGGRRRR